MVVSSQLNPSQYEEKTQAIAQELILATRQKGNIFSRLKEQMQFDDKLMNWTMSNPGLRVQLFRFIDALPALQSKGEVMRHLQQYLTAEEVELPNELKGLLNFTEPNSPPAQIAASTITKAVETLAYKYISGETIKEVIKAVERMRKEKNGLYHRLVRGSSDYGKRSGVIFTKLFGFNY